MRGWRGETEIFENAWSGEIATKLMRRIRTSYRYVTDIIGTDLFTLEELGGVDFEKLEKFCYF